MRWILRPCAFYKISLLIDRLGGTWQEHDPALLAHLPHDLALQRPHLEAHQCRYDARARKFLPESSRMGANIRFRWLGRRRLALYYERLVEQPSGKRQVVWNARQRGFKNLPHRAIRNDDGTIPDWKVGQGHMVEIDRCRRLHEPEHAVLIPLDRQENQVRPGRTLLDLPNLGAVPGQSRKLAKGVVPEVDAVHLYVFGRRKACHTMQDRKNVAVAQSEESDFITHACISIR